MPAGLGAGDWTGIRAAHEAWQRSAIATPAGLRARHREQRWTTSFDGRGFTIQPDEGGWTWGLRLERWGFEGALRDVEGLAAGCAEGERVEYGWDASLTEWYVNAAGGLEHGYTVHQRPAGEGALVFELAVLGGLAPILDADGRGARFVEESGAVVLSYAGLLCLDATGRALEARLAAHGTGLRIGVDERGALYPLTIDPIVQQAYVKASNTGAGDDFGNSVSVFGDTVVVGATGEDSGATGVDGDGTNNSASNSGAAYVFVRNGTAWSQQAYLKASNTGTDDKFGHSVSVSGDTVVVGAVWEDSNAMGVGGDGTDNSASDSGAAYVFVRSGTSWSQQAYLKASNTGVFDHFGHSVSVSGDTVIVGARLESSSATGVDGDQSNNGATDAGAAYVFVRSGTAWSQSAYLKASNTGSGDQFGYSVAVSGDSLVIGALLEDSSATGVNGGQADNSATDSGAAYVFVRSGTNWSQQAYLKPSNTGAGDWFGASASVSGDTLVVGARLEDSNATGVNGNESNNSATDSGAAYAFVRSGTSWIQQAYIKASNSETGDRFGYSVSVSGVVLVVGANTEDSGATGVNADGLDNSVPDSGAAYVFARSGTTWSQLAYLKASNTDANDAFGWSVSVHGATVLVGAWHEDSSATGVNGDGSNNSGGNSGASYVFHIPVEAGAFCFGDGSATACPCGNSSAVGANQGCLNSFGQGGELTASGVASLANDTLVLAGLHMPSAPALYFQGTLRVNGGAGLVFGDGLRCVGGALVRLKQITNVGGASQYPQAGDPPVSVRGLVTAPGLRVYQIWYRNSAPFCTSDGWNLTNGVELEWLL